MIQFWNIIENVDFEAVLTHFDPFLAKWDFFQKIRLRHFFSFIEP